MSEHDQQYAPHQTTQPNMMQQIQSLVSLTVQHQVLRLSFHHSLDQGDTTGFLCPYSRRF
ncbi:Uncharacterised protein [Chlamydia trachomatis]|nr:Uncharacterised protein [Chlamydia trachomatis]